MISQINQFLPLNGSNVDMKELKEKILKEGKVCPNNIVKVDSFLNHQVDVAFLKKIGEAFYERFKNDKVDKVLTIESSGIAIACFVAECFNCRLVFAKKGKSLNQSKDFYEAKVFSYTRREEYDIRVSKEFICENDNVLLIDDFLANGAALNGLVKIVEDAKANLVGCGVVIEKGFQPGGKELRDRGIHLESLAIIENADETKQTIEFRN